MDERQPAKAENWEVWEKNLASSVMQFKESIMGDPALHDGIKTLAWLVVSNATEISALLADAKRHDLIQKARLISSAAERAFEIITTDRPLTDDELSIMNVDRAKYEEITKPYAGKNRVIGPAQVPIILEEIQAMKALGV